MAADRTVHDMFVMVAMGQMTENEFTTWCETRLTKARLDNDYKLWCDSLRTKLAKTTQQKLLLTSKITALEKQLAEAVQSYRDDVLEEVAKILDDGNGEMSSVAENTWKNICRDIVRNMKAKK